MPHDLGLSSTRWRWRSGDAVWRCERPKVGASSLRKVALKEVEELSFIPRSPIARGALWHVDHLEEPPSIVGMPVEPIRNEVVAHD